MPTSIRFKITTAGRNAALDAQDNGLSLSLTQIAVGTGQYDSEATGESKTALVAETSRFYLADGDVEPASGTLRFSAVMESGTTLQAFELGLIDSNGVLFAVASTTGSDPLVYLVANIAFIITFGLVLTDIPADVVTVSLDPNAPLALVLMNQHLAAANPHPQYAKQADLLTEVDDRQNGDMALSIALAAEITRAAPYASPAFTGNPTAPTQPANDNSEKLASTEYVDRAVGDLGDAVSGLYPKAIAQGNFQMRVVSGVNTFDYNAHSDGWHVDFVHSTFSNPDIILYPDESLGITDFSNRSKYGFIAFAYIEGTVSWSDADTGESSDFSTNFLTADYFDSADAGITPLPDPPYKGLLLRTGSQSLVSGGASFTQGTSKMVVSWTIWKYAP